MSFWHRCFLVSGLLTVFAAEAFGNENLDAGKSGPKLFTANCTECHRTPRGLAKDQNQRSLAGFLKEHYTASAATADELAAFLLSSGPASPADTREAKPKKSTNTEQRSDTPAEGRHQKSDSAGPADTSPPSVKRRKPAADEAQTGEPGAADQLGAPARRRRQPVAASPNDEPAAEDQPTPSKRRVPKNAEQSTGKPSSERSAEKPARSADDAPVTSKRRKQSANDDHSTPAKDQPTFSAPSP